MTIEQYNERLQGVIDDLQGGVHADLLVRLANDAIAMIRDRVQQKGETPEGGKYAPYSTKPMLSGSKNMTLKAFNRIAGSKKKRKELDWVTLKEGGRTKRLFVIPGGYKEYRDLHGRQTGYVDFTFTGRLLGGTALHKEGDVKVDNTEISRGIAIIAPKSEEGRKIMEGNVKRRGAILALSDNEKEEILNNYDQGILQIWRRNGL